MIQRTSFVLAVPDLELSAGYYQDILGFEVHEMGDSGWRLFTRGECRIMAGHCPDAISPKDLGDHSYFGYFTVDDIDEYYRYLCSNDVNLIKEIRDEPWGMREFGIRTNDGHRIMIGQPLERDT